MAQKKSSERLARLFGDQPVRHDVEGARELFQEFGQHGTGCGDLLQRFLHIVNQSAQIRLFSIQPTMDLRVYISADDAAASHQQGTEKRDLGIE